MTLRETIKAEVVDAMRAGDAKRRDTLRLLLAAIKQAEVDRPEPLTEADVEAIVAKQAKQRQETIADARSAGREDLVAEAQAELEIIDDYLPEQLSRDEIASRAEQVIAETGATGMQDMGTVMGRLMPQLQGQADGRVVSEVVRQLLSKG